jgi:hypothetical protein
LLVVPVFSLTPLSGRNSTPAASNVSAVNDDVTKIDADAKPDHLDGGRVPLAIEHSALHLDGAPHRVDNTAKFDQHAVAGRFDNSTAVLGDLGINKLPPMRPEAVERSFLIGAHQPRVARDISGQNGGKPALDPLSVQYSPPCAVQSAPATRDDQSRPKMSGGEALVATTAGSGAAL